MFKDKEEFIKKLINFFDVMFYIIFDGELIANDFKYLRDILDTMVDIKDKEEFIKKFFLSYHTSFRPSFWRETDCKWFKYIRDMLDTMVDVDIKDKKEFIKQLM